MDQQSAIEEIALIKRVIEESREFTYNIGKNITTWGILISIAIFGSYGAIKTGHHALTNWIWAVAIGSGWIFSIIIGIREKSKTKNLGIKVISFVWTSCGIAMTILGFAGTASGGIKDWAIAPVIATVMGTGFAGTAFVQELKWVMYIAIAWWLGALFMFFVESYETLPIFGVMMILFMVVPGIVFHKQWRDKQLTSETK
jgi:hypothetical protein